MVKEMDGQAIAGVLIEKYCLAQGKSPEKMRETAGRLLAGSIEEPWPEINWPEATVWSAQCGVQLKGGGRTWLLTDGWPACYEDTHGYRWFFRRRLER